MLNQFFFRKWTTEKKFELCDQVLFYIQYTENDFCLS